MKAWKKWSMILIIVISMISISYMYIKSRKGNEIEVKVYTAGKGSISSSLSSSGTIMSKDRRDYYVYTTGRIEKVYVSIGDRVEKNELLIKLETPDLTSQLKQAYMQFELAQTALDNLIKQKSKMENSTQIQGAGIPVNMLTNIDDQIKLQKMQVEAAGQSVDAIKEKISSIQSEIKAIRGGIVTGINAVEGSMAAVGIPLVTVEDTSSIKAVVNVSQYDAYKVKQGQEVLIKLGTGQSDYRGVVEKINPTAKKIVAGVNAETSIPVDVSIINPDGNIKVGYDVDVEILTNSKRDVIYVPYEAIITDKDKNNEVYVVQGDMAVLTAIKTGLETDFNVEIVDGIKEGDRVILNPPADLKNSSAVKIKDSGD